MQTEKQPREQRIEVARSVEVRDLKADAVMTGYTKNMSENGVLARLDQSFRAGEILELSLALENENEPLVTHGEVVWCSPEIYGEGAEVGLKFIEIPDDEKPVLSNQSQSQSDEMFASPALPLTPGKVVTLLAGDEVLAAIVEEVSHNEAAGGPVHVHLRIKNELAEPEANQFEAEVPNVEVSQSDEELLASAEDWKPHPFRDAKQWFDKYVMPAISVILAVTIPAARLGGRGLKRLWKRVPIRPRVRVESFVSHLRLNERASQAKQACLSVKAFASKQIKTKTAK